jgi:hypothetical protein
MLSGIVVTAALVGLLAHSLRPARSRALIARRPYNNRYSDAAGAREDHLG